ncbi:mobilization protein [Streptomyces nanshensis]|uniref:Mobilization protein n=1 Tax=Streptomyces nanshensis TaxID=518642 RepID=A0A1E7LAH2_9ACTN|nr:mobilization protein [Streptomyces nanshensis]OEV13150.1 mobilization protein [Streptomyces nanshensis]
MIPKIILGKTSAQGLIRYLYGKGKANTHTDPHLVASWNGFAPDPGRNPHHTKAQLARQLDQPVRMLGDQAPETKIWHCPVRAAPGDRHLTDEEWAQIARRIVHATGIAPEGDTEACRWVAIRHAPDHIHIAATLVRQDGKRPHRSFDRKAAQAEARRIETDYDLRQLNPGDGTAVKRPTSKEHFKAKRQGNAATAREILRTRVRRAVAAAANEPEFFTLLEATGVEVKRRIAPSGDLLGYSVALPGDTNKHGEPVWFSGSTLAGDLSLPKIRQRLTASTPEANARPGRTREGNPWHHATAATERIPHHLTHGNDTTAQGQLAALGETLDLLPLTAPEAAQAQLQHAATAFERATRSRITAEHNSARVLRHSIKTILRDPAPTGDGAGIAMLIDAALIAVAYAMHWHRSHQHAQQQAAARQTLHHLQTAYAHIAQPVLQGFARRAPEPHIQRRYAYQLKQAVPAHADRILNDPAWNALTTALADAEVAGHDTTTLLDHALGQRTLDDAHNPAAALTWRIHRLGHRHTPSPRAQAAKTRTTPTPSPRPIADAATPTRRTPPRR